MTGRKGGRPCRTVILHAKKEKSCKSCWEGGPSARKSLSGSIRIRRACRGRCCGTARTTDAVTAARSARPCARSSGNAGSKGSAASARERSARLARKSIARGHALPSTRRSAERRRASPTSATAAPREADAGWSATPTARTSRRRKPATTHRFPAKDSTSRDASSPTSTRSSPRS